MTATQLKEFIEARVPTYKEVKVLGAGSAFHYTSNGDAIDASDKFLGAPIDDNLDRTQLALQSPPATCDPGVVYGYLKLSDSLEEGFGCDIFEIQFREAVSAIHSQEQSQAAMNPDFVAADYPATILILTSDIIDFKRLGPADDLCKQEGGK
jgi:hypothetical protein